jgi:heat shock protein HtpX
MWSNLKVFVLMAGLTALLGAVGQLAGGTAGLAVALVLALGVNAAMYFWSARLVLRMYGARVVAEREAPELYEMVDRLRRRAGLPMPTVAIAPHDQPNAFATGRSPAHGVVCVTEGLLALLGSAELEGVIAHELAHIKNRDMLLQTVTATVAGAVSHVANVAAFGSVLGGREEGEGPGLLGSLVLMVVAPLAAMLIQLAISRQREFAADRVGAEICGRPLALASALRRLEAGARQIPMAVAPAAAPLAMVNPLAAYSGGLVRLFSTHPPTEERVARLEVLGALPETRRAA